MKMVLVCFCLLLIGCDEINRIFPTDEPENVEKPTPPKKEPAPAAPPAKPDNPENESDKGVFSDIEEDVKDMYFTKISFVKEIKEGELSQKQPVVPENLPFTNLKTDLKTVRELLFNGEKIYIIPFWWKDYFIKLKRLQLRNSGLSSAETVKLKDLTTLEELDLSDNPQLFSAEPKQPLTELWKSLSNLKVLKLSNVQATETDIGDLSPLKNLKELDLSFNKLTNLKALNISGLNQLTRLNLAHNNLATNQDIQLACQQQSSFAFEGIPAFVHELNLQNNQIAVLNFNHNLLNLRRLDLREKCQNEGQSRIRIAQGFDGLFELHFLEELNVDADIVDIDAQILEKLKVKMQHNLKQRHQVLERKEEKTFTVIDIQKKLEWQMCNLSPEQEATLIKKSTQSLPISLCKKIGKAYTWHEAMAEAIKNPGWRLPDDQELKSLVFCGNSEIKKNNTIQYRTSYSAWFWNNLGFACQGQFKKPVIREFVFPKTLPKCYWTVSESDDDQTQAWQVNFNTGAALLRPKKEKCYVRLVRDVNTEIQLNH